MARSILSLGIFSWRAASTAARRRGFIAGSGVPSLAATVISRASLPNSFDFWASCRPLRCMMFLNWEWPAIAGSRFQSGNVRWKARPYRLREGQNQRTLRLFGALVGGLPIGEAVLTMTSCPNERMPPELQLSRAASWRSAYFESVRQNQPSLPWIQGNRRRLKLPEYRQRASLRPAPK